MTTRAMGVLLLALSGVAKAGTSTAPVRYTAKDVGRKSMRSLLWDPHTGKTATQPQREAIVWTLRNIVVPQMFRFARQLPCDISSSIGVQDRWNEKLADIYPIDLGLATQGEWQYRATIYDLGDGEIILDNIHNCAIGGGGYTCAKVLVNPSTSVADFNATLDALDLKIVLDASGHFHCVDDPDGPAYQPTETFNTTRSLDGKWTTKVPKAALTAVQLQALDAATACHGAVSAAKCGGPATTCSVQGLQQAFEKTAVDEAQHAFFRLHDFGGHDPTLTATETCARATAEHMRYMAWEACVKQGDQLCAFREGIAHGFEHQREAIKNPKVLYRVICPERLLQNCPVAP